MFYFDSKVENSIAYKNLIKADEPVLEKLNLSLGEEEELIKEQELINDNYNRKKEEYDEVSGLVSYLEKLIEADSFDNEKGKDGITLKRSKNDKNGGL